MALALHSPTCTPLQIRKQPWYPGETPLSSKSTGKQKGFSLIELLIGVAIILIIAAIAIPNLLRARIAANEASAVGSVRSMVTSATSYASTYGNGFPAG